MCHFGTTRTIWYTAWATIALAVTAAAQVRSPAWRALGSPAAELNLAAPATGPVQKVWYSNDGAMLYVRTGLNQTYQTGDFATWKLSTAAPDPPAEAAAGPVVRLPEAGARLVAASPNRFHVFALGRNLSRTDDGGHSWTNLTAYKSQSVVGAGQHSVAVSPNNPDEVVLGNDYGVWRSLDGGLTWSGLNQSLPNLAVRRILSTPTGTSGARILADNLGALELTPGTALWQPAADTTTDAEAATRQQYAARLKAEITAVAVAGDTVLVGASDGRLWWSRDGGQNLTASLLPSTMTVAAGNRVERIWLDASQPTVALAAVGGSGPHIFRTSSRGLVWDALDAGELAGVPVSAVVGDRASKTVYVASNKGVYYGHADLEADTTSTVAWQNLTGERWPRVHATDVRLDSAGVQLYIALEGYGVFAAAAPHRADSLRIVNAADSSTRPAAPGSLLSVIGAQVSSARAANLEFPVLQAFDNASQIQVPFEAIGDLSLTLQTSLGQQVRGLTVQAVSPAILTGSDGLPVVADADNGLAIDVHNPARSNGRIQIMATGLGRVRPDWPTGVAAPAENPPEVVATVRAYLDGQAVTVTRATLAPQFIGFYVVEIQLPAALNAGVSVLHIAAGGQESNRVQIAIEP